MKHLFPIQISDPCSTSRHDLLNDKRPRPPWLHVPSWIKIRISKHLMDQVPFFKVSWFHFLVKCPRNPFLEPLCIILCPSPLLIYQSQLFISRFSPIVFSDLGFHQYPQRLYIYLNRKHRLTTINQRVRFCPSRSTDRSSITL